MNLRNSAIETEIHKADHSDITGQTLFVDQVGEIHDFAKVTGLGGGTPPDPTGNVEFTLFSNLLCDAGGGANVIDTETVALVDDGGGNNGIAVAETAGVLKFIPGAGEFSYTAVYIPPVVNPVYNPSGPAVCEPLTIIAPEEGCTPGFWRNHLAEWCPTLDPGDHFDDIFFGGVSTFNITLAEANVAKGGGDGKVARHGTAALLNVCDPAVDYPFTEAQVIAAVVAGNVDALATANELSDTCPALD